MSTTPICVDRRSLPAQTWVTLRDVIANSTAESELWARFAPEFARQDLTATGPGGVLEHDTEYTEADVDCSVWLPVAPDTTCEPPLQVLEVPASECVVATVVGPYDRVGEAVTAVIDYCTTHCLDFAGTA